MDDMFVTNAYRVLRTLYFNSLSVGETSYCPLGQREVALDMGLSRISVNKIFVDLRSAGYITMLSRGKWKLTDKGMNVINTMETL